MKKLCFALLVICFTVLLSAQSPSQAANYLVITGFGEESNLQKAGAETGDILTKYDNKVIMSLAELTEARDNAKAEKIELVVTRAGKEISFTIPKGKLGAMLEEFKPDHEVLPDAKILKGYGKLLWRNEEYNSFLACLALVEGQVGAKTEYYNLMGLSGYGFRVQFYPGFCPSAPDAACGKNVADYILPLLGYKAKELFLASADSEGMETDPKHIPLLRETIRNSIDAGYPLLAVDLIEVPDWGLITGYQKDGSQYWCRTFYDKTWGYEIAQKEPWGVYAIEGYQPADLTSAYGKSLALALEMYETKEYDGYLSGLEAYRAWIEALRDEKAFSNMSEAELGEATHGNWWNYMNLLQARYYCMAYLSDNKDKFGADSAKIDALSSLYGEEIQVLGQALREIPSRFDNPPREWTPAARELQIEALQSVLKLEEKVVEILKTL